MSGIDSVRQTFMKIVPKRVSPPGDRADHPDVFAKCRYVAKIFKSGKKITDPHHRKEQNLTFTKV